MKSRLEFKETISKNMKGLRDTKHRVKMCLIEVSEVEERDWAEARFEERKPNFPELKNSTDSGCSMDAK